MQHDFRIAVGKSKAGGTGGEGALPTLESSEHADENSRAYHVVTLTITQSIFRNVVRGLLISEIEWRPTLRQWPRRA